MTDDQQFILGCLTLILPTVASILAYRKTEQTHQAVNGMQVGKVKRARAAGVVEGRRRRRATDAQDASKSHAEAP